MTVQRLADQAERSLLEGAYKQERDSFFTWFDSDRGYGFKLKESTFRLNARKKYFTQRVVRH